MPWRVEKRKSEFCVIKEADGTVEGCHATRTEANKQLAALNIAESGKEVQGLHLGTKEVDVLSEEKEQKMYGEMVGCGVPFGVMSFAELETAEQSKAQAHRLNELTEQFQAITANIMHNPDTTPEEKTGAVSSLADEFGILVSDALSESKERWQPLTDIVVTKVDELTKAKAMKTEGGIKFPASDFAYVPDPEKPSTWKLRMAESRPGNITKAQLGRAAAAFSSGGFRGQKVSIPSSDVAKVKAKIRAAYKKIGVKDDEIPDSLKEVFDDGLELWKESDGVMHWLSFFSNNYRDDDRPAEILSADAHRDFVKAVDGGEWPLPELWFWHVPGSKFGQAEVVAFDENTSMVLAMGTIDKGKEDIAEYCQAQGYKASHGMPAIEIRRRDENDPTIITRYRTKEVSWLPVPATANKHTSNYIIKEGEDMNIPKHKLEEMKNAGFDLEALTQQAEQQKAEAEAEGRESKELEPVEMEQKDEGEVQEVQAETAPALDVSTIQQAIASTVQQYLEPLVERVASLEGAKEKAEEKEVETEEKEWDLGEAIRGFYAKSAVIDHPDAETVDGRKARHEGPKETNPNAEITSIPFIDQMLGGGDWRDGLKQ